MKVIELFCGTGTLTRTFREAGHEVLSIDNNPDLKPDMVADVLNLQVKDLPKEFISIHEDDFKLMKGFIESKQKEFEQYCHKTKRD